MKSLRVENGGSSTKDGRTQNRVLLRFEVEIQGKSVTSQYTARFDENGALIGVESEMDGKKFVSSDEITLYEINPTFAPDTFEIKLPPGAKPFKDAK